MIVRPMKLLTSLRASYSLRWLLRWPASCQKPYEGSSIHNLAETKITCEFNLESTHYLRSCEISNTHPRRRRNLARRAHCIAHPTALRAVRPGNYYIVCRRSSASIHARKAFLSSLKHRSTAHSRSRHYAMAANRARQWLTIEEDNCDISLSPCTCESLNSIRATRATSCAFTKPPTLPPPSPGLEVRDMTACHEITGHTGGYTFHGSIADLALL